MHDYNTILGVIELRLSKVSYDAVQKRYRIGRSGIALIMNRYKDSGLSLDDLRQMPTSKVVDLIYPKENLRHKDIPLPDFEKIHEQMIQMGKHADLSFLWIDYKKEHPKTSIYRGEREAVFAGYLIRINQADFIDSEYLTYYMNSFTAKQYGNNVKTDGVNQSNINGKKIMFISVSAV